MKSLIKKAFVVDALDTQIIQALSENSRLSIKALSRQVGLSAPSCSERLRLLERIGIIRGYRVDVDPELLGVVLSTVIRIKAFAGQLTGIERLLIARPECVNFYRVTGEDDFICIAQLRSVESLDDLLQSLSSMASTHTSLIKTEHSKLVSLLKG